MTAVMAVCTAAGSAGVSAPEAQALLPSLKANTVQTLLSRGASRGTLFSGGLYRERRYFVQRTDAEQWDVVAAGEASRRHQAIKAKARKARTTKAPTLSAQLVALCKAGMSVADFCLAAPHLPAWQIERGLSYLLRNRRLFAAGKFAWRRFYVSEAEALAAVPELMAQKAAHQAREAQASQDRRNARARKGRAATAKTKKPRAPKVRAAKPAPAPEPRKPAMTPSKHVAKRGPAGTAQEPDMSRAIVTVYQPPPSRYAVPASEFVGMFSALGPGRYLNTEVLKG